MEIQNNRIDEQLSKLTITLTPDDYSGKFQNELSKQTKKVQLKGFRKGKTPIGMIRKLYGKSILADVINTAVQEAVETYLKENDIDVLAQPIPSEEQKTFDFDPVNLTEFEFSFDIAEKPAIQIDHVSDSVSFRRYVRKVDAETVKKELENLRKRAGERVTATDEVQEDDVVALEAVELENGEPREGGHECKFSLLLKAASAGAKKEILGKNTGDSFQYNVYELEENRSKEDVHKYLLDIEEDAEPNEMFSFTIAEITRIAPAELNEEFFEKAFGENQIKTEEEALKFIEDRLNEYELNRANSVMYRDFQDYLIAKTEVAIPESHLKRLLAFQNENVSEEDIDKDFDKFLESFKWQLIEDRLAKEYDIKVENEEIVNHLRENISAYFSQYGMGHGAEELINSTLMRIVKDQEQVNRAATEVLTNKLMDKLKETFSVKDEEVSEEKFAEISKLTSQERQEALFA